MLTFTLSTTDNAGAGCPVTHTMRQSHFPGSQSRLWFWLSHAGDTPLPPSWFGSSINLRSLGNGETQPSVTGHQVVKESPGRAFMPGQQDSQGHHTALGLQGCHFKGPEYAGLGSNASFRPTLGWQERKQQAPESNQLWLLFMLCHRVEMPERTGWPAAEGTEANRQLPEHTVP